jgi:hypothetical protein
LASFFVTFPVTDNPMFRWSIHPLTNFTLSSDHPLYLFLHHYIPRDIVRIFEQHLDNRKLIKSLLIPFIYNLHLDIYQGIWKLRSSRWKDIKRNNNITKSTFKNYRKRKRDDNAFTS